MNSTSIVALAAFISGLAMLGGITTMLVAPDIFIPKIEGPADVFITVRGGDLDEKFGFALDGDNLTTPGPIIRVKVGDLVNITFINEGEVPHTFAVVEQLKPKAKVLFHARIGSPAQVLPPGTIKSILFRADKVGEFHYMCEAPGHQDRGMHGIFIVEE